LSQNASEQIRLSSQKHPNILRPFGLIAGVAGQTEVADSICSSVGLGLDMLNLKRDPLASAVATGSFPLFQQIVPDFIPKERALLILQAAHLWMVHLLQIELDQFQAKSAYGTNSPQSLHPGEHVGHSAFQRRGTPPVFPSPIRESGLSVTGFALSSPPAYCPPLIQRVFDGLSPMHKFRREDHFSSGIIDQGDPGCLAPWINLDPEWVDLWFFNGRLQNDREGIAFEHSRFALFEQVAGTARMDRVQGLFIRTQHKDLRHVLFLFALASLLFPG
jgi:hypothetical protein